MFENFPEDRGQLQSLSCLAGYPVGNGSVPDGEKLQAAAFKTGALSAKSGAPTGAAPGAIRSVVQAAFAVKPAVVSKVVGANGEPLLVSKSLTSPVR